jgi:hypothetical protein
MSEVYTQAEIDDLTNYLDTSGKKYDALCEKIQKDIAQRNAVKTDSIMDVFECKNKIIEADDVLQEKLQKRMMSTLKELHEFDVQVKKDMRQFENVSDIVPDTLSTLDYY